MSNNNNNFNDNDNSSDNDSDNDNDNDIYNNKIFINTFQASCYLQVKILI